MAAVIQLALQVLLAGAAPALLLAVGALASPWDWWDREDGQLLLGTTGWHVRTRLQGLGRQLQSIFLAWLSHVLVVQSLTP